MTGPEFQKKFCEWLRERGYWALDIPRSKSGSQPFDVIAMKSRTLKSNMSIACDCKVISGKQMRFPLERVEVNQWLAFDAISRKTKAFACIAVFHAKSEQLYIIPYYELKVAKDAERPSILLLDKYLADDRLELMEKCWWD